MFVKKTIYAYVTGKNHEPGMRKQRIDVVAYALKYNMTVNDAKTALLNLAAAQGKQITFRTEVV